MPQGFKPLKRPTIPGTKQKRKAPAQPKPKVGKRIAPKKKAAVQDAVQKRVRMTLGITNICQEKHSFLDIAHRERNGTPCPKRATHNYALTSSRGQQRKQTIVIDCTCKENVISVDY